MIRIPLYFSGRVFDCPRTPNYPRPIPIRSASPMSRLNRRFQILIPPDRMCSIPGCRQRHYRPEETKTPEGPEGLPAIHSSELIRARSSAHHVLSGGADSETNFAKLHGYWFRLGKCATRKIKSGVGASAYSPRFSRKSTACSPSAMADKAQSTPMFREHVLKPKAVRRVGPQLSVLRLVSDVGALPQ